MRNREEKNENKITKYYSFAYKNKTELPDSSASQKSGITKFSDQEPEMINGKKMLKNSTVKGEKMTKKVGLWIDHRKAVIVSITGDLEEIKSITSGMEKHIRFAGGAAKVGEEDQMERKFNGHLNIYYDEVISFIRDAESVLIFGPGEAKIEFKKRLEGEKRNGRIISLETTDKMTDHHIALKVRDHFLSVISRS